MYFSFEFTPNRGFSEYGLQYILSLIDSDIPKCVGDVDHEFPMRAVCLNLDDLDDNGKLFLRSF